MPDLTATVVTNWLDELLPPSRSGVWPPPIRSVEKTTPDELGVLGAALDRAAARDLTALGAALRSAPLRDDLHAIIGQLGAARLMRLLHWLSEADVPACHDVINALIEGDGTATRSLRAVLDVSMRQAVLRQMFAPSRIAALEEACQINAEEAP
jgi:hypothetical protein